MTSHRAALSCYPERIPPMKRPFFARYGLLILMGYAFALPFVAISAISALRTNSNDVKSWLPAQYEETQNFRWYWNRFESDAFILVSWEGCTLDDPRLPD